MVPMHTTINEYLHEHFTIKSPHHCKMIYEPCNDSPINNITGCIYIDGRMTHTFMNDSENFSVCKINKKSPNILRGYVNLSEGLITFFWDKIPKNHFLCVSYNFGNLEILNKKNEENWALEGF